MNKLTLLSRALVLSVAITTALAGCSTNTPEESAKNDKAGEQTAEVKKEQVKQPEIGLKEDKAQQNQTMSTAKPATAVLQQTQTADHDEYRAVRASAASKKMAVSGARISRMVKMKPTLTYAPGAPSPQFQFHAEQPNRENYAQGKINPVYNTDQNPVSTFSIDVDTASYANVRRLLNQGQWPDKGAIRVEEMINYFNYDYPAPETADQPFAVHTEVATSPWNPGTHLMRIALKGYQTSKENLPPMNLVFLFDVSGSMNSPNKLPLLKQAFSLLTKQLRAEDHVSMVVYAGASGLVLKPTAGDKQQDIMAALDKLSAGGSTNGGAGIELAYKTAQQHFTKGGINRVILATDGDFNVGTTNMDKLKALVEKKKQSGVFLSILGFGQGNYNDHLMEELSNIGNGTAYYV
ncbi:MAG: von Willebrand factor type A domain-containing protein, partial [Psychrosphaera sp.]|nr:von Willebrand factor type A domain-containing protein [Psychrosphaera sp.]